MIQKLIGRTGDVAGRDFVMPGEFTSIRIGAAPISEICVAVDGVSREHARLVKKPDGLWVEDAGSRNGTFVNGQRRTSEKLHHLDVITLARHVDLIFVQSEGEVEAKAATEKGFVTLERLDDPTLGPPVEVPIGELLVGRSSSCHMMINHPTVGKTHARIVRTEQQVSIEDLKSANGTFVNNRRITMAALKHDDKISIAGVARLQIHITRDAGVRAEPVADRGDGLVYDQEWRTRLVWSPTERIEVDRGLANALKMMEAPAPKPRPQPAAPTVAGAPPAGAAPRAIKSIELLGGPDGRVPLALGRYTIGRRGADVRLADGDRGASRIHGSLTVEENQVLIEDRSANGTFVNDERLTAPHKLRDGDKLRCGSTTFTVKFVK